MKIIITVSQITPGGGLTKYVCTLSEILSRNTDNEVFVITTHHSEKNEAFEELQRELNLKHISLGHLSTIKKYISLILILRKISPDIIINNYNATTQYILPFISSQTKVIHVLHSITEDYYRVASINARYVDKWIVPTPALAKYFNEYTSDKYSSKVVVIPHGVDKTIHESNKSESIPQLTYVGVLYEHKGVKILPDIIKKLLSRNYKFHFTFIGDGVLRKYLEEKLSEEVKNNVVEFTGRITGQEVYKRLSVSDIFVYPTHIDAFGLVIAEAMINENVPVVTCLEGITDSIIDNGVNGYLIKQDNIDMFVEKISLLFEDRALTDKLQKAAKEKAISCFSIEVMKNNYLNFIKGLK